MNHHREIHHHHPHPHHNRSWCRNKEIEKLMEMLKMDIYMEMGMMIKILWIIRIQIKMNIITIKDNISMEVNLIRITKNTWIDSYKNNRIHHKKKIAQIRVEQHISVVVMLVMEFPQSDKTQNKVYKMKVWITSKWE